MEWCVASRNQVKVLGIHQVDGGELGPSEGSDLGVDDPREALTASQLLN